MTLAQLYLVLLGGGAVVLASIAAARTADRLGLPSLLLFLALGVAIGEDGLGLQFDDAHSHRTWASPRWRSSWSRAGSPRDGPTSARCSPPPGYWPPSASGSAWW